MIKSYKIRLYPTKEQEILMWKHIGSCRFIWNYMLNYQEEQHKLEEKHLSAFSMIKLLTPLKKQEEFSWLNEVSNTSLQIICQDLNKAYSSFFKKQSKFPKFKSKKRAKQNFPVRAENLYFKNKIANIEKIGKIKYKTDLELPQGKGFKFTNPRISYNLGKWILSFGVECENQTFQLNDYSVGIDLGVKEQCYVAFGDKSLIFHNINKSKRIKTLKNELVHHQRSVSRKYEASKKRTGSYQKTKNIEKEELIIKKIHNRISNIRDNYIHQTTHTIVELLPQRVVMEDLNVSGMMNNKHLSKAIAEQNFYKFISTMKYKCEWHGIEFVQVGRFFPSSKLCSCCGQIKKDLKLKDRVYKCGCGLEIDRDLNAAINLSRYVG